MAGTVIPHVLVVISAIVALNCVSALPRDIFPTADDNLLENSESIIYPPYVNNQPLKMPESEDKPKSCFHFFVSRNMSSLLAEATKMLRTIRDRREREWILTFIYRIKSLAEHLRSHPESRNYDCLPTDDEEKKRIFSDNVKGPQQPELYFVDDVPKRAIDGEVVPEKDEKISKDNQDSNHTSEEEEQSIPNAPQKIETGSVNVNKDSTPSPSIPQTETSAEVSAAMKDSSHSESAEESKDISVSKKQDSDDSGQSVESTEIGKEKSSPLKAKGALDGSIVLSSAPDCDSKTDCRKRKLPSSPQVSPENYFSDAGDIYPMYQADNSLEQDANVAEFYQQEALKERIRKVLLEELAPEIKKLRTVGGTEEDLMALWNLNDVREEKSMEENDDTDFDYEEPGAAAGDLNMNEKVQPDRTVAPSLVEVQNSKENPSNAKDSSYEPYDDSDVLVQQLFDVRFNDPPSKTTKSLNDPNNEYLVTSTQAPF